MALENLSTWSPVAFEVNVVSSLVGALVGVPAAVFVVSQMQLMLGSELAAEQFRRQVERAIVDLRQALLNFRETAGPMALWYAESPSTERSASEQRPLSSDGGAAAPAALDAQSEVAAKATVLDDLRSLIPDVVAVPGADAARLEGVRTSWRRLRSLLVSERSMPRVGRGWSVREIDEVVREADVALAWLAQVHALVTPVPEGDPSGAAAGRDTKDGPFRASRRGPRHKAPTEAEAAQFRARERAARARQAQLAERRTAFEAFWSEGALRSPTATAHIKVVIIVQVAIDRAAVAVADFVSSRPPVRKQQGAGGRRELQAADRYRRAALGSLVFGTALLGLGLSLGRRNLWDQRPFTLNILSNIMAATFGLALAVLVIPRAQALLTAKRQQRELHAERAAATSSLRSAALAWVRAGYPEDRIFYFVERVTPQDQRERRTELTLGHDVWARPAAVRADSSVLSEVLHAVPGLQGRERLDQIEQSWASLLDVRARLRKQGEESMTSETVERVQEALAAVAAARHWIEQVAPLVLDVHVAAIYASFPSGSYSPSNVSHLDGDDLRELWIDPVKVLDRRIQRNPAFEQFWNDGGMRGKMAARHLKALLDLPAALLDNVPPLAEPPRRRSTADDWMRLP
ncbi:MAG: hypothetical protein HGA44_01730 [Cellulomonadaceae bacterium]|nr:hypothetical protein [Cellulomonadaceae bacterium]